MIPVEDAVRMILEQATPLPPRECAIGEALGLILATSIRSDIDSPPHDKSMVDGYAIRVADLTDPSVVLEVIEEVAAGQVPTQPVVSGGCTRIMTGAPIPQQADAVVMVEDSASLDGGTDAVARVRLTPQRIVAGRNIMRRGASIQKNEIVLQPGHCLRCIDLGLLAEVGATRLSVHPTSRVAVLSTGDELVACSDYPGPGQIRNSNSVMLDALVHRCGASAINLGIARDRRDELTRLVLRGLEEDVLVLSGGVSAGVLDLVPSVLEQLGVRCIFHKVRIKPGKPLWFGVLDDPHRTRLVFGLPGNPVSSLVCFELFVRPALRRLSGRAEAAPGARRGELQGEFLHRGPRPTYHPARVTDRDDRCLVETLPWKGSADMRALVDANALACFPAGDHQYSAGEAIMVLELQ